jgi:hypothetical protein
VIATPHTTKRVPSNDPFLVHRHIQVIQFGEDWAGVLVQAKGFGIIVVLGDVAVDRGLQVDNSSGTPRA